MALRNPNAFQKTILQEYPWYPRFVVGGKHSAENLGKFHIEPGLLNELDFHFTATEKKATGQIIGEYHDLVIDKLTSKQEEKKIAKVPSFFLKYLIIPKNKDKSMDVSRRTGKISYNCDPTRFMSYYFLKGFIRWYKIRFCLGFSSAEIFFSNY